MARRWSPADMAAMYAAQVAGESATDIAARLGCNRNAVLGAIYRHRVEHRLPPIPPVEKAKKAVRIMKERGTFRPPSILAAARRKAANRPKLIIVSPVPITVPSVPRCEAVMSDGSVCGREAVHECMCLGHRHMSGATRLRLPPRRIVSGTALREEIERAWPRGQDARGRACRAGVPGMTRFQLGCAFVRGRPADLAVLAGRMGWERLDDDTYRQRRAA